MKDRVPKYPGRVIITPTGKANEYDIVRADEAVEEGSVYNKGNVLPDNLCNALGLDADTAEVKDALSRLHTEAITPTNYCKLVIQVLHADGTPWVGAQLTGIGDVSAAQLVSNENGLVAVHVTKDSYTIGVSTYAEYVDMGINPIAVTAVKGTARKIVLQEAPLKNKRLDILTTRTIKFSDHVETVDVFCVGGGGGGYADGRGAGGGGGYTQTGLALSPLSDASYAAVIGAGGSASGRGGQTSLMGVSAEGGHPGSYQRGGDGGSGGGEVGYYGSSSGMRYGGDGGTDGGDGRSAMWNSAGRGQGTTTKPFSDLSEAVAYAGGGGGGADGNSSNLGKGGAGGVLGGGKGGDYNASFVGSGKANTGGGGGGSGMSYSSGGSGGSGIIIIRWRNRT